MLNAQHLAEEHYLYSCRCKQSAQYKQYVHKIISVDRLNKCYILSVIVYISNFKSFDYDVCCYFMA